MVFEGKAGKYPVRVVVRQPEVVPGLVEIHIRVLEGTPTRVTALPMHASTDRRGAPKPDVALPVPGDSGLYSAQLWFMTRGAYGVEVAIEGDQGGSLIVPVNSVALDRKPMPFWLTVLAVALLLVLATGVVSIAAALFRESTLAPGELITPKQHRWSWAGGALGLVLVVGAYYGANVWWQSEDQAHRTKVLFKPMDQTVRWIPSSDGPTALALSVRDPRTSQKSYQLLPDHGKVMHLFLVGEGENPAFVHLHPNRDSSWEFRSLVPGLPPGAYRVFGDVLHESGVSETFTNRLELSSATPSVSGALSDPDDAWMLGDLPKEGGQGITAELRHPPLKAGEAVSLDAVFRQSTGDPAPLQPYLRMLGHAVVMRVDGSVFAHVHPAGTLNMAAARKMAKALGGEEAAKATDAVCGDFSALPESEAAALGQQGQVHFPYVFPTPGEYWIWIQTRVAGQIQTRRFRVSVS